LAHCVYTNTAPSGSYRAFGATHLQWIGESQVDEQVTVRGTDTRYTPYDRSTGASRSTTLAGLAVQRAAEDVLAQLREIDPDAEPARYPELIARRFGLVGGELIGRGEVAPRGSGSYAEGPVFWE